MAGLRRFVVPVLLGVVLGVFVTLGTLVIGPRLVGWQPLTIVSGSMTPVVHRGDVVVIDRAPRWPVPVGTVVTYRQAQTGILVTHRVVSVDLDRRAYLTRGDANPVNDSQPVPADAVLGQARLLVPFAGLPTLLPGAYLLLPVTLIGFGAAAGWGVRQYLDRRGLLRRAGRRPPKLVTGMCLVVAAVGLSFPGEAGAVSTAQFSGTTATSYSLGTKTWSVFAQKARTLGPVSYWTMDETGTTTPDLYGGNTMTYASGTSTGLASATSGGYGRSIGLTYLSHGATTAGSPANLNLRGPMSVMAWVKLPTGANTQFGRFVAKYQNNNPGGVSYILALGTDTTSMRFLLDLTAGTPSRPTATVSIPADNAWHFYVGTWDGTTAQIYRDGVAGVAAPVTGAGQVVSTGGRVEIGAPLTNESGLGQVDEAAIWDRALTQAEISALYSAGTT